jgi:ribosome recycling factor
MYMIDFENRTKGIVTWLQQEFSGIRTGQASPALLDSVRVENYGSKMPINQVASVGIEDARTLRVSPWDASLVSKIESAIRDADLGVSLASDSSGLRVIFPELTSERRVQLLKLAGQKLEDARISVRGARDEAMKALDKQEKDGELSKDAHFAAKEKIQKHVDTTNRQLESLFDAKEAELNK